MLPPRTPDALPRRRPRRASPPDDVRLLSDDPPSPLSFHLILKRPEVGVLPARIDLSEDKPQIVLGRGAQAQCYIFVQEHPSFLSRAHAHILLKDNNWYIKDLISINGTCVNLNKLNPFDEVLLKPGDHIYFGNPHQSFFIEYEFRSTPVNPPKHTIFVNAMQELPRHIWSCQIFYQLSLDDLVRSRQVCKQWKDLIDATFDIIEDIRWDGPWPLNALQALLKRKAERAAKANSSRTILRSLTSEGSFQLNDERIRPLAELCGTHLKNLDISGSAYVSNDGLRHVASYCTNLERLSARGCKRIGFDWSWLLLLAQHGQLVEVDLHATGANDPVICHVLELSPRLERLACGVLLGGGVSDATLGKLAKCCPRLAHLDVRGCKRVTDAGVIEVIENLPNLQSLVLRSCNVGDTFLKALGTTPRALRALDLHRCVAVTDDGLNLISKINMPYLEHLDLSNLGITDKSLISLARCDTLLSLDLRSCRGITGRGVLAVVGSNSSTLRRLDLNGCVGVTPSSILEVSALGAGVLKELEIGGSMDVTSAVLWQEPEGWMHKVRQILGTGCKVHDAFPVNNGNAPKV